MSEQLLSVLAKEPESTFEPIADGTYNAVCVSVVDMGTQTMTFKEESREVHRIRISWELEIPLQDNRVLGKDYTLSLHVKSSLRTDLKTWLGKDLSPDQLAEGFNVFTMLGKAAKIGVTNEGDYANVTLVLAGDEGVKGEVSELIGYSVLTHNQVMFDKLPEFVQKRVATSKEGREIFPPL